jgi:hypothetical protein
MSDAPNNPTPPPRLTDKQRAWVASYLRTWNATEAARQAGYSDPEVSGWENKQKPAIQATIRTRLEELKMGADEVLLRVAEQARGSVAPFLRRGPDGDVVGFDLGEDKPLHLLRKVTVTERRIREMTERTVTVEAHDAQAALFKLGDHHKLWGKAADLMKLIDISKLNDEQLERLAEGEDPIKVLLG